MGWLSRIRTSSGVPGCGYWVAIGVGVLFAALYLLLACSIRDSC